MYQTPEFLANQGLNCRRKEQFEMAIGYYQKALNQRPVWPEIHLEKGLVHSKIDDLNGAIYHYQKAIEQNPKFIQAYYHLGIAYQKNGQINPAINIYQSAVKVGNKLPDKIVKNYLIDIYNHLGYLFIFIRNIKAGIQVLKAGIDRFKTEAILHNNLGQAFLEAKQEAKAVVCFKTAIKLQPNHSTFYHNLGKALQRLNLHRDAIASYQRAIQLEPESIIAQSSLGEVLISIGQFKAAIACFKAASSRQSAFVDYYCSRARTLTGKDELERSIIACGQFLESLKTDQDFSTSVRYLNQVYIHLGNLLVLTRQYKKAEPYYQKSLQINPRSLESYGGLKLCLEKQEKRNASQAIQQLIEAAILDKKTGQIDPRQSDKIEKIGELQDLISGFFGEINGGYNLPKCEGLNCQACLKKISKTFQIKAREEKIYSLEFTEQCSIGQVEVKVCELERGRVWVAPQKNHWLVCDRIAVWNNQHQLIPEFSRSYPGQLPLCQYEEASQNPNFYSEDCPAEEESQLQFVKGKVAVLVGLSANVYFHWMVDILPRFDILQKGGYSWDSIDGFIVNSVARPFQRETLEKLGVPADKVIESDRFPCIEAEQLIVPSFPSYLGWLSSGALAFHRSLFLTSKTRNQPDSPTRIYISREKANYRQIINEAEVMCWLSQWGFVRVELESMSVEKQVTLFANAEIIVSAHGSGLTNLMFCCPGTTVVELVSPHYIRHYFWVISQELKLRHFYLKGEEFWCYPVRHLMYPNPLTEDILISLKSLKKVMKIAGIVQHKTSPSFKPPISNPIMDLNQNKATEKLTPVPDKTEMKAPPISAQSGLVLNSEDTDIYLQGVEALYTQKKYEQTVVACQRILVIKPHAKAYKILGNVRQSQGQLEEAKNCYAKAIQLQPDFAEVFCNLGTLYAQQQEWQPAVICYQKAIGLQPELPGAYRNLARIWARLGKKQEAAECWYNAYRLHPESVSSKDYLDLGNILLDVGLFEKAIYSYCQAIEANPYSLESYQNLGEAMKQNFQMSKDRLENKNTLPLLSSKSEISSPGSIEKVLSDSQLKPNGSPVQTQPQENLPSPPKKSQVEHYIRVAESEAQLGNLSAAIKACQQALQVQPDAAIAYKILGQIEQAQGHRDSAQKLYEKAINFGWKDAEIYLNLGTLCAQKQQWEEAVKYYRQSLNINPKSAIVYHNLSKVLKQLDQLLESARCLYQAYRLDPQRATAKEHFDLGDILLQQNETLSAIACYKQAIQMDSNLMPVYQNIAEALKRQGKLDEAELYLQKLQQLSYPTPSGSPENELQNQSHNVLNEDNGFRHSQSDEMASVPLLHPQPNPKVYFGLDLKSDAVEHSQPSDKLENLTPQKTAEQIEYFESYLRSAEDCLKQKQFKKAILFCKKLIEIQPNSAVVYKVLGNALQGLGRVEEAKEQYNKALTLDPNLAEVYANLGTLSAKNKQFELAISYYQKAISLKPNLASAYRNLAKIWKGLGKAEEWAECSYQVFALESEKFTAEEMAKLAESMLKLGKIDRAVSCYEKSIQLDQSQVEPFYNLGEILTKKQQWEKAIVVYQQGIKFHPQKSEFYYRLGQVLAQLKRWEEAITAYNKALNLNPNLAVAYRNLGEIWIAQAQFDQAIHCYRQLIELEPKNWAAYHRLGDLLQEQGQLDEAVLAYRQAIQVTEFELSSVKNLEVEAH